MYHDRIYFRLERSILECMYENADNSLVAAKEMAFWGGRERSRPYA